MKCHNFTLAGSATIDGHWTELFTACRRYVYDGGFFLTPLASLTTFSDPLYWLLVPHLYPGLIVIRTGDDLAWFERPSKTSALVFSRLTLILIVRPQLCFRASSTASVRAWCGQLAVVNVRAMSQVRAHLKRQRWHSCKTVLCEFRKVTEAISLRLIQFRLSLINLRRLCRVTWSHC